MFEAGTDNCGVFGADLFEKEWTKLAMFDAASEQSDVRKHTNSNGQDRRDRVDWNYQNEVQIHVIIQQSGWTATNSHDLTVENKWNPAPNWVWWIILIHPELSMSSATFPTPLNFLPWIPKISKIMGYTMTVDLTILIYLKHSFGIPFGIPVGILLKTSSQYFGLSIPNIPSQNILLISSNCLKFGLPNIQWISQIV